MRIADRKQGFGNRNRKIYRGALAEPPIIQVAAEVGRRHGIDQTRLTRRHAYDAKVWPQRNPDAVEYAVPSPDRLGRDGYAGIVVGVVHDAVGIGLGLPSIGIERLRIGLVARENLIDRHRFARLGLREKLVIVISPPGGDAAAENPPPQI